MIRLRFESHLASSSTDVWARVATMEGVNAELAPWIRMTYPEGGLSLDRTEIPLGQIAFHSWVLAFGVLPFDRHALGLDRVLPARGFDEHSHSWTQRRWIHRRRVFATGQGCRITDELEFEPRMSFARPLVRTIVAALFRHRHRRLRRAFGSADG